MTYCTKVFYNTYLNFGHLTDEPHLSITSQSCIPQESIIGIKSLLYSGRLDSCELDMAIVMCGVGNGKSKNRPSNMRILYIIRYGGHHKIQR